MKKLYVFASFFLLGLVASGFLIRKGSHALPPSLSDETPSKPLGSVSPSMGSLGRGANTPIQAQMNREEKYGDQRAAVAEVQEMRSRKYFQGDLPALRRAMNGSPHWIVRREALRKMRPLLARVSMKERDKILGEAGPSLVQAASMSERELLEATFYVR